MRSYLLNEKPYKRKVGFLTGTRQQLGKCLRVSMLTEVRKRLRDAGVLLHTRWQNMLLAMLRNGKRSFSNFCGKVGSRLHHPSSQILALIVVLMCLVLVELLGIVSIAFILP